MRALGLWFIVVSAAFWAGRVFAEEVGPKPRAAPNVKVTIACPKTKLVAGENLEFSVTLQNTSDKVVNTAPLQPFAFLELHVLSGGKVLKGVKVNLSHVDPDVAINPGQTLMKNLDLCKWFPLGIYAGTSEVSVNYFPVRSDRSVVLKSNVVKLEVRARTPEQEKEYQDFLEMRRADSDEAFVKYRVFLKRYPKSMFEPRVRLHYAGKLYIEKEVDQVEEVLGDAFERSSPTQPERTSARYLHARTLKENGRFKEALSVLQDVDEPWAEVERLHLQYMAEHGPPTVNGVPQYMVEHIPPPAKVEPQKEGSEQKGTGGWLLWAGFALGLTLVLVVVFVWRVRRPAAQNPA